MSSSRSIRACWCSARTWVRRAACTARRSGLQDKYGAAARLRHQPVRGRHHRPRRRHGARGTAAGGGDPVPQVRRSGGRAAQRLRHDALAHAQPLRRADRGAHARGLLQVRRSLAQPDERGRLGARHRLAGRGALATPRTRWVCCARRCAATIRSSSSSTAPCSMAPGRAGRIRAMSSSCRSGRRARCAAAPRSRWSPGERWSSAASRPPRTRTLTRRCSICVLSHRGTGKRYAASVEKTHRCLIVHEDNLTAGFGAEIAATLAQDAASSALDAPIERLAMPDIPSPHSPVLLEAAVPGVARHLPGHSAPGESVS